jgi:DNA (cytosine-5)-methyltransferase 1
MISGLIIDSFAGGGGASTGIERALGRSPDYAINHDPEALAMHAANHPACVHLTENIWKGDPHALLKGRKVGLLWASPDCLWPEPTHGDPKSDEVKRGELRPWRTAAEIIDWGLPCPSIFIAKEEVKAQGLKVIRPLAPKTMSRIARGFKRYVLDRPSPFIVVCNHAGDGFRGQALDQPAATVTRARDAFGLVSPYLAGVGGRMGQSQERSAETPYHTIMTKPDTVIVTPHLMTMRNSGKPFTGADEPAHTVTAGGAGLSVVEGAIAPFVTYGQHGGRDRPIDDPHHTVTASRKETNSVACAWLAQHNGGVVGHEAEEPVSTVSSTGAHQQPVMAYISRQFGQSIGHGLDVPSGTITGGGAGKSALVSPFIASYYSTGGQAAPADEPLRTVPTHDRFAPITGECMAPPLEEWQLGRARQVADFLRAEGVWHGGEFVTVGPYVVWDVGMRMLTPRELARAQGFPDDYILAAPLPNGSTLTETAQRHKIGNSVCPPVAEAIIRANCIEALNRPQVKRRRAKFPGRVSVGQAQQPSLLEEAA